MLKSGLDKSAQLLRKSFGDWETESEFSWSDHRLMDHSNNSGLDAAQRNPFGNANKKIVSRRAAAYWEIRK